MGSNLSKRTYVILEKLIDILEEILEDYETNKLKNIKDIVSILNRLTSQYLQLKKTGLLTIMDKTEIMQERDLAIIENFLESKRIRKKQQSKMNKH